MLYLLNFYKKYPPNPHPNGIFLQPFAQESSHYTEDMAGLLSKGMLQKNGEGKLEPRKAIDILIMLW